MSDEKKAAADEELKQELTAMYLKIAGELQVLSPTIDAFYQLYLPYGDDPMKQTKILRKLLTGPGKAATAHMMASFILFRLSRPGQDVSSEELLGQFMILAEATSEIIHKAATVQEVEVKE